MPASIIDVARDLRSLLAVFDARVLSGSDCLALADELGATEKACAAAGQLAALRAVDCRAHEHKGFRDGADWLARQSGTTAGRAKRNLKTASKLDEHPETKQALLQGQVSLDQAGEILQAAEEVPGSEKALLDLAKDGDLSRVREKARDTRLESIRPEQLHERQRKARTFRAWTDQLGMIAFAGALPPETGVPFLTRLEREADRIMKEAKQAGGRTDPWEAHAADAFAQMISGHSKGSGGQTDLTIVCDLRAWRRGHAHPGEPCHILDGGPIPVDLAEQLGSDAFLNVAFHDGFEISKFARLGRHIPVALRAALDIGQPPDFTGKRCTDCGKRFRLELDHVDPVANGGPTSYGNLEHRCFLDHQAKTERDRKAGLLKPKGRPPP